MTMPMRSSSKAARRMDAQGRRGTLQPEPSSSIASLFKRCICCVAERRAEGAQRAARKDLPKARDVKIIILSTSVFIWDVSRSVLYPSPEDRVQGRNSEDLSGTNPSLHFFFFFTVLTTV